MSVTLLLNKQDRLKAKVLDGRFKIETYFHEYSSYQLSSHGELIVFLFIIFTSLLIQSLISTILLLN